METYFYAVNDQRLGPFTLEELKSQPIAQDTLIWKTGEPEWKQLREHEGLRDFTLQIPPPLPGKSDVTNVDFSLTMNARLPHLSAGVHSATNLVQRLKHRYRLKFSDFLAITLVSFPIGGIFYGASAPGTFGPFVIYAVRDDTSRRLWIGFFGYALTFLFLLFIRYKYPDEPDPTNDLAPMSDQSISESDDRNMSPPIPTSSTGAPEGLSQAQRYRNLWVVIFAFAVLFAIAGTCSGCSQSRHTETQTPSTTPSRPVESTAQPSPPAGENFDQTESSEPAVLEGVDTDETSQQNSPPSDRFGSSPEQVHEFVNALRFEKVQDKSIDNGISLRAISYSKQKEIGYTLKQYTFHENRLLFKATASTGTYSDLLSLQGNYTSIQGPIYRDANGIFHYVNNATKGQTMFVIHVEGESRQDLEAFAQSFYQGFTEQ